jgi:sarcosine oxidase subunit beta
MAMAGQARQRGVVFREKTAVTKILETGGKVSGVSTSRGEISCPCVVNAAGPWAGEVAEMGGVRIPVAPHRRQVFVTGPCGISPRPVPMVLDVETRHYFRGEGAGLLTGMSDMREPPSFNTHTDREFMETVVGYLLHRMPGLGSTHIVRGWAGLYAITPDENPIIGPLGEVEGFFGAVGFSGHGFQHGPAAGKILSDLILVGRTDLDISPFRWDRFNGTPGKGERRTV